jgi:hypothetical protein
MRTSVTNSATRSDAAVPPQAQACIGASLGNCRDYAHCARCTPFEQRLRASWYPPRLLLVDRTRVVADPPPVR